MAATTLYSAMVAGATFALGLVTGREIDVTGGNGLLGAAGLVVWAFLYLWVHDVLAGSTVVYDWGDRPAEIPAPITRWFARHGVDDVGPGAGQL